MTLRDEFAALLKLNGNLDLSEDQLRGVSTLLAFAGCRLPPRVITTEAELYGLARQEGAILEDSQGETLESFGSYWYATGNDFSSTPYLPARVIREAS